jgi:hypothetical protein
VKVVDKNLKEGTSQVRSVFCTFTILRRKYEKQKD